MTLPEPLARKRDAMEKEYGEDEQVLGPYRDGFDACHEILAEENEKLREELRHIACGKAHMTEECEDTSCNCCENYASRAALSGQEKGKTK